MPSGWDEYILKNIIHDWNDERALEILSNCRSAMNEHGKILLVERLLQARVVGQDRARVTATALDRTP